MKTLWLGLVLVFVLAVSNLKVVALTATWSPNPSNDGVLTYTLYQSVGSGPFVPLATVPSNVTTYVFSVPASNVYTFAVTASNACCESARSIPFVLRLMPPNAPTGCQVK